MTNSREPKSGRGNTAQRRRRKLWLLSPEAGWGGDGIHIGCSELGCAAVLTYETLFVDRIVPGEQGGRYINGNVKPHCGRCSHRQGQRRTVEICKGLLRTCRYCGRVGQKQFTQMGDGSWRCKSPDYCQRRSRARTA